MRVQAWKLLVAAVALITQAGLAAPPALAASPPITITAGMPGANPAGHNFEFTDFFPRELHVPQGATIQFAIMGFHTATLLPAGTTPAQDARTNGVATPDSDDTTPNPNGTSHTNFNVGALLSSPCGFAPGPACNFDGSAVVSAGPFSPPEPFVVRVTAAPGVYAFHCRVHPGMTGQLTVVSASAPASSPTAIAARVQAQVVSDVNAGLAAEAAADRTSVTTNPNGSHTWFLTAGTSGIDGRVNVLEFLPRHLSIASGDSVVWVPRSRNEPHTVTFPVDLFTDTVPLCETATGDIRATPLHLPPQGPFDFACPGGAPPSEIELAPGNGVTNVTSPSTVSDSGLVAPARELTSLGLPSTAALPTAQASFAGAGAGTYTYICQIHGAPMDATITVH